MEIKPLLDLSIVLSDFFSPSGVRIITAKFNRDRYDYNDKRDYLDYTKEKDDNNFTILVTGVGVINAAHGLTVYLENCIKNHKHSGFDAARGDLIIIQTGIAGFFKGSGLKIGDIAVATSETYIHTGVGINVADLQSHSSVNGCDINNLSDKDLCYCYPLKPLPFDLVNNSPSSKNSHFTFDKDIVKIAFIAIKNSLIKGIKSCVEENNLHIITGDFLTVSTITAAPEDANHLFKAFNRPCMESMEGAASAHIAALYNIPFIEVRAGSNPVGVRNKENWNIPLASQRASFAVKSIIEKRYITKSEGCFDNNTSSAHKT